MAETKRPLHTIPDANTKRVIDDVYAHINSLFEAVHTIRSGSSPNTEGTMGDIRLVKDGQNLYRLEFKHKEGWVSSVTGAFQSIGRTGAPPTLIVGSSAMPGVIKPQGVLETVVTPGSFTSADITIDAYGRVTAAANGGGAGAPHNLLSATHSDTLAAAVVRGDIIVGNLTPKWSRLALGTVGQIIQSDGTDVVWHTIVDADIPDVLTITKIGNLTTNGFVKTGGGDGTLSVDTSTYLTTVTPHDLLSATHGDTVAAAAAAGDMIYANSGIPPKWTVLTVGSGGQAILSNGTLPVWGYYLAENVAKGSFTTGSVIFMGAATLSENNASFFWDDGATKMLRLGGGTEGYLRFVESVNAFYGDIYITSDDGYFVIDSAQPIFIGGISATPALEVNTSDQVLLGTDTYHGRLGQRIEVATSANLGGAILTTWSITAAEAPLLDFSRSKSATIGTHTIVASGDCLGYLQFRGSDGVAFQDAAAIRAYVDGTPGVGDMPGRLLFLTTSDGSATLTERMRITSAGQVFIGSSNNHTRLGQLLEVAQTANYGGAIFSAWTTTASQAPIIDIVRSKSATIGTMTAVANGDDLGYLVWRGADGTNFIDAAYIKVQVDGTPGATDMPGRLMLFTTADGAATGTERMRITSAGDIGIACTPSYRLDITGNGLRLNGSSFPSIYLENSGGRNWRIFEASGFNIRDNTAVVDVFTIDGSQRVGLSKTAPTAILHIGTVGTLGHIRMDGIAGNPASPTDGDHWYNTTLETHKFRATVGTQGLVGLVYAAPDTSNTVSNTTTETDFDNNYTLPASSLTVGKSIRVRASGVWGQINGTVQFKVYIGANAVYDSGAMTLTPSGSEAWWVEADTTIRTTGCSGVGRGCGFTIMGINRMQVAANTDADVTINTNTTAIVKVAVKFNTANAGNTAKMTNLTIEVLD